MIRVYVAGPYSADNVLDVLKNIGRGQQACARLFQGERFRPVRDDFFGEYYQVSSLGRVYSLKRKRFLKPRLRQGYERVALCHNYKMKNFSVHSLVAVAFLGLPENGKEVNHKNGNKADNRLSNIEYATKSENTKHSYTLPHNKTMNKGENNGRAKLTSKDVRSIRELAKQGTTVSALCKNFKVSKSTISQIKNKTAWRHI
jgi:hypothetical protein